MEASTAAPIDTEQTYINGEPIAEPAVEEPGVQELVNDQLDDLEIQVATREWTVEGKVTFINPRNRQEEQIDFTKTYAQKPLSYTAMLQFTGLIGDRISTIMSQGVTLDAVLGDAQLISTVFTSGADLSRSDFSSIDSFVSGLAKLASYLPSIIEECQCIWLRIPLHERPVVTEIWGRSPEDGGLSVQEGEDMLNLFIAQNYRELEDFFAVRLGRILRKAQAARKRTHGDADLPR